MKISHKIYFAVKCFRWKVIIRSLKSVHEFIEDSIFPICIIVVGENSFIHTSTNFKSSRNIFIGSHVRVQPNVLLWASPNSKIIIGDFSGIGPGTKFFSSNHDYEFGKKYIEQPWNEKDIVVGENVWIGAGCILTAGVTIGEGAVIGAGSVVTRDIPSFSLAVGHPAKVIKSDNVLYG